MLDTETATLPFANSIAKNAKQKQKIAIAKPLVYDIAWVIMNRQGEIVKKRNYLVQETFFVPNVFNTAYYKEKRPIYMNLLKEGKIETKNWNDIVDILLADLRTVDISTAYNATFDFKKAIPFTERYIKHLYSEDYNKWESRQFRICQRITEGEKAGENPDFLNPIFNLRGEEFPIADLWSIACDRLINIDKYRNYCLDNSYITASTRYFKTSAETAFQYLMKQYDFSEDHTALSDSEIESQILAKALKRGKIEPELDSFPFRNLGTTFEYVLEKKPRYQEKLLSAFIEYMKENDGFNRMGSYWEQMRKFYMMLSNN